ncbi:hypothetical protein FHS15_004954 [Paenibacillus castaneae]|nr:hypothetical protein [Paenibacillus castaneae]
MYKYLDMNLTFVLWQVQQNQHVYVPEHPNYGPMMGELKSYLTDMRRTVKYLIYMKQSDIGEKFNFQVTGNDVIT